MRSSDSSLGYCLGVGDPVLSLYPPESALVEALDAPTSTAASAKCTEALLAASPDLEDDAGADLQALEGSIPDPARPPSGPAASSPAAQSRSTPAPVVSRA